MDAPRGVWLNPLLLTLALGAATACGADPLDDLDRGHDAGTDATVDAPDAMPDAMPDAGPFPVDPHAGQFAWAVLLPGLGGQVVMATAADGTIFLAATHEGAIDVGGIDLPPPVGGAIAVLKLDAQARPIWARSLGGGDATWRTNARSVTVTTSGDVVVSGAFVGEGFGAGAGPLPSAGGADGFVARLDGATGATRWARSFGGAGDDAVSSVAADPTTDDVYLFGQVAGHHVDGVWQPDHAFLERLDRTGAQVWSRQLPLRLSWQHAMALDVLLGPVVSGRYDGVLDVDGFHLEVEPGDERGNLAVIGFTADGVARFARQIFDESSSVSSQRLLAAPDGRLYVGATTMASEIVLDDGRALQGPDASSDAVLVRLSADGAPDGATLIDAEVSASPHALAADADGAVYLAGGCDRGVALAPAITCADGGSFLVSYGPGEEYRWSTYISGAPAWAHALASVAGANRLLVAGVVGPIAGEVDFGGVKVPGAGVFVAALVTGPSRSDPRAPVPVVTAVELDGVADGDVRQGGAGVVVIRGEHLERVQRVRIGSRDLFPTTTDPGTLRFPYVVPHGERLGPVPLRLEYPGGQLEVPTELRISPIVVAPTGTDGGRGTIGSPWRLCRGDWQSVARRGDTIRVLPGTYPCEQAIYLHRGVIVDGAATATTRLGTPGRRFGPIALLDGPHGQTSLSGLTIQGGYFGAVTKFDGVADLVVRDVDFAGLSTSALSLAFTRGRVALARVRYLAGQAAVIDAGGQLEIEGRALTVETTGAGVILRSGSLALRDASLKAGRTAIELGDINDLSMVARHLVVERSALSATAGIVSYGGDLEVADSTLVGSGPSPSRGIELIGGTLTLRRSSIEGFDQGIGIGFWGTEGTAFATNLDLDDADITAGGTGVLFGNPGPASWLRVRGSRIAGDRAALRIWAPFASADLGTAASPGANALTSSPTGHALRDDRDAPGAAIDAAGTTLDGRSFTGQLLGPRNDRELVQRAANVVRF